jgi:3-deoxy-D-manno-octulosonic-acid transferase
MYVLYSLMLGAGLLLSSPYWLVQMLRTGKYRAGVGERLGRVPPRLRGDARPAIWVHAVSVGEVLAVSGVVRELRARFPGRRVVVSTTTATGQKLARERFGAESVFYFPLDFAFAIRPWLRALRPELVVLAETEFWPNFLRLARMGGAGVAVVNARISDRSVNRYRRFRGLMRLVLGNIDVFLAQSDEDRRRLLAIGAPASRVEVSGNLKFDIEPPAASPVLDLLRAALADAGPVVVCGSTVEGEEPLLLAAVRAVLERWPTAVVILAPRHPERFDEVARLLEGSGLRGWRRSQWQGEPLAGGIFLLDTIGELAATYALAQAAFIGGSLVARGGHNVLEPAQAGAAILVGPYTENFRDIINLFREAGALRVVSADELGGALISLLSDETARTEMTRRAAELLRAHAGATARTVEALEHLLRATPREARR